MEVTISGQMAPQTPKQPVNTGWPKSQSTPTAFIHYQNQSPEAKKLRKSMDRGAVAMVGGLLGLPIAPFAAGALLNSLKKNGVNLTRHLDSLFLGAATLSIGTMLIGSRTIERASKKIKEKHYSEMLTIRNVTIQTKEHLGPHQSAGPTTQAVQPCTRESKPPQAHHPEKLSKTIQVIPVSFSLIRIG